MQGKPVSEQEIGKQLLLDTVAYAETNVCRRKVLLHYFGEEYELDSCNNCDNCLYPKVQFDGQDQLCIVLETVEAVKEQFKAEHVANIISGLSNSIIKSYNHHLLDLFSIGKDKTPHFWNAIIRQALILKMLDKDIENYGLLILTDKGRSFLLDPEPIMLTEDREFTEDEDETTAGGVPKGGSGGGDMELLALLKDLRKDLAKKMKLPAFVIFQDPSLEDMSIQYPISLNELKNCQGVGEGKAKKYGTAFISLIAKYVEENEIERPQDMVVKSVINKSVNKVYIIQSIDRKLQFEDIAEGKGMQMDELFDDIEAIVNSGTKLNIDYYLEQALDEDKLEEIYDYFRNEATSESIREALEALGSDFTEEEVRLVRIKFLSELGN
jgi:ATP-dependent DNA helicase RecQ